MKKKKQKEIKPEYPCGKCDKVFVSIQNLDRHVAKYHPAPYIAPPKKTVEVSSGTPDSRILLNAASHLGLGDIFYRVEKHVIKQITFTEGSQDVRVETEITKSHWQKDKPII